MKTLIKLTQINLKGMLTFLPVFLNATLTWSWVHQKGLSPCTCSLIKEISLHDSSINDGDEAYFW